MARAQAHLSRGSRHVRSLNPLPRGERERLAQAPISGNTTIAMAAMLFRSDRARLMGFAGEGRLPARGLGQHIGRGGATIGGAGGDRGFDGENLVDAAIDAVIDELEILDGQALEPASLLLGHGNDLPGNVMGVAERDVELAHQPVGHIGGGGEAGGGRGMHVVAVGLHVRNHAGHGRQRQGEGVERIEGDFLVFLHVLGIGERQALHYHKQRVERSQDAPDLGAHQFGGVRIALLRHDRGAGGELVRELDEAELGRRPDHHFLGKARQMHGADRAGREGLENEITVRDGVERICGGPVKAQCGRGHVAIDRVGGAGQGRRSERAFIEARARILKPSGIAAEHFDIGQQMMAEGHRLGILQMGEAGQDGFGLLLGAGHQRKLQRSDLAHQRVDIVAHIELEIGGHLVVARAGRVQAPGGIADLFAQPAFDIHMDVFECPRESEVTALDFGLNLV